MLVVVGSRHDPGACEIVRQWQPFGAALLACEDLSVSGWRFSPGERGSSQAVIGGHLVRESEIRGVLVRRPQVLQQELPHIAAADREFVAAEMTAFLFAWLSQLSCRVLNGPRGLSLCGPHWRPQQWHQAAAKLGLETVPEESRTAPEDSVVIVGGRCLGAATAAQAAGAKKLAIAAGVSLLSVWFAPGTSRFLAASTMPSLSDRRVADAVREHLLAA